jgi:ankyrin repeat protein
MNRTTGRRRARATAPIALSLLMFIAAAPASEGPAVRTALAGDAPVADAAMRGDIDAVRALVKQGADVNAAQGDGMTALHWAGRRNDVRLIEVLLYAGADREAKTRVGAYTPLLVAAREGNERAMIALLDGGSAADAATSTGVTALHFAAGTGRCAAIEALLARGADPNTREKAHGQTPLMFAADAGQAEAITLLASRGADVAAQTNTVNIAAAEKADDADMKRRNERVAALEKTAIVAGESTAGRRFDEPGATVPDSTRTRAADAKAAADTKTSAKQPAADEKKPAADEKTPPAGEKKDAAKESEEEKNAPQPLSYGELIGETGGLTALLHAARQGHTAAVEALLNAGADINQLGAGDGSSAMLIATMNGHWDLALRLLALGADVNLASQAGTTPLYAALNLQWAPKALYPQPRAHERQTVGYLTFMEKLLEAGADPNVRLTKHLWFMSYNFDLLGVDTGGATTFWRAAYATDVSAMKLLVAHGADPGIPTEKPAERRRRRQDGESGDEDKSGLPPVPIGGPGVYPIHAASGVGYGKDFAANSHRHVPDGWLAAVRYLVEERGADVNARDYEGFTPLHHAASRGDVELIRYLVDHGADVMALSRKGQTTADMANGPVQRVQPFPEAVELLMSLGSKNSNKCLSC